ncbi:MAG: site-2 protease family protein [Phycisphaerae bacterium]
MFGRTIKLFKIFDFQVSIDLSWLIIMALVVWSLAGGRFPEQFPELSWQMHLLMGLAAAVGLFGSIVLHEMSHSLVARRFGLPMEGITLFLFGGVAQMRSQPPSAKAEFFMAVAGPVCSVLIAAIFLGAWWAGETMGLADPVAAVLFWIGSINVILVIFNLIPGFPLDGGRVLRSGLWAWKGNLRWATDKASTVGRGFGALVIAVGVVFLLTRNFVGGIWWILIGMFIRAAAGNAYRQVLVRQALSDEPLERFMNPEPVTIPADMPIDRAVDEFIYEYHFKMFPVVDNGRLVGCLTTRQIKDLDRDNWSETTAGQLAADCSEENTISSDSDAVDALAAMRKHDISRLMVVDDGELRGICSLKDLSRFLSRKLELEGDLPDPIDPTADKLPRQENLKK